MVRKKRLCSSLLVLGLVISVFYHMFLFGPVMMIGCADEVSDSYHNETALNVTILHLEPRINWYDLQNGTGASLLNDKLDVNQEYYFKMNISSDHGWAEIEYINITAWHDLGSEANGYNSTVGGNINFFLQYENITGIANWTLIWPDNEMSINVSNCSEINVTGYDGSPGNTESKNLTFAWTPGYQFRYAPDPIDAAAGHNDTWSWNFNITCDDLPGYHSYDNPLIGETIDEFGVYSYTEVIFVGWPVIVGHPGTTASVNDPRGSGNITIISKSNGNYSLSANVDNLTHKSNPTYILQNTSIQTQGGDLNGLANFPGNGPLWYYGSGVPIYHVAENDDIILSTSDIEWAVQIPIGQQPGDYNASIYYHLTTQL
ncbi:hypothetical protein HQ585_01250 [candidate division KSB1 bacterium]|nr:hypothetical protein [candidate division KSB1 bacterium]